MPGIQQHPSKSRPVVGAAAEAAVDVFVVDFPAHALSISLERDLLGFYRDSLNGLGLFLGAYPRVIKSYNIIIKQSVDYIYSPLIKITELKGYIYYCSITHTF